MSCGKKRIVKNWDHPKKLATVKPSRYEQNEDSVKVHWRNVVKEMEMSYKDDQFWDTQCDTVREQLGPKIFRRVAKIFNLPLEATTYEPQSETSSIVSSERFYQTPKVAIEGAIGSNYSMTDFTDEEEELEHEQNFEEEESLWSVSTVIESVETKKSLRFLKSSSKMALSKFMSKSFSKNFSKTSIRQASKTRSIRSEQIVSSDSSAHTLDDLDVHGSVRRRGNTYRRRLKNPHYDMLYCKKSETDMIKWKSKYKVKMFEISAADEMSEKAEIITKQISKDFYDWWVELGNVEFKSEIKRLEDIESLFQVWFDEHASRGLMLYPKILPCVLTSIANYADAPEAACPKVLKQQIALDVEAETTPAHLMAFGTCLPHKMKHIPPDNNTKEMWDSVKIPEDLRTMSCVWDDITHLTSTKAFQKWLEMRPQLPMPECLMKDSTGDKKVPFLVPSDFVVKDKDTSSLAQDLALPVSQFDLELKEVLSKLMNH